jgi:hypothetical protein
VKKLYALCSLRCAALNYTPPPPPVPDSVVTYDLLRVFRADTLMKADTKLYDLIYVYRIPCLRSRRSASRTKR